MEREREREMEGGGGGGGTMIMNDVHLSWHPNLRT